MAYATLDQLTSYLGIDESYDDDNLLSSLLARAQAAIDSYTRRTFEAAEDTTRYHNADYISAQLLMLDGDCCAVTAVANGSGAIIPAAEYRSLPRNRTPFYALQLDPTGSLAWDADGDGIAVTGRWAYSVSAPADVTHACIRLAAWFYRQKDNTGLDAPMISGSVTILPVRLPADVAETLKPYRRVLAL